MIRVNDVVKKFDGFTALDRLSMHVPKGAVYGLVGPNGAGKSTILRHITGAMHQDAGEVLVAGEPVWENEPVKARMAFIPDDIFFFNSANVRDMQRFYRGLYPRFDDAMFETLLKEFAELDPKKNIRGFSKGMQRQTAFLLALCARPEILVLDEPVDGLDPIVRRKIWRLILADVAERETTVLISSQNLRELEDVCDHVGILKGGKLLLEHSLDELQGNVSKFQIAFNGEVPALPEGIRLLHDEQMGRVHTLIIEGDSEAARAEFLKLEPVLLDVLPLSLEEIFIYEIGGADHEDISR